jgi:protein TonB
LRDRFLSLAISAGAPLLVAWVMVAASLGIRQPAPELPAISVTIATAKQPSRPVAPPRIRKLPEVKAGMAPPDVLAPSIQIAVAPAPVPVQPAAPLPTPASAPAGKKAEAPQETPPRFDADYLKNPAPVYPNMSRRLRETGTVQVRVRVSAMGEPLDVQMAKSSGYGRLDEAALAAVKKWKFQPALRDGAASEAWVLVPVEFSLKG